MHNVSQIEQTPEPDRRMIRYRGDLLPFSLRVSPPVAGRAFLRTNLGRAAVRREELVAKTESDEAVLARDWHDIPMTTDGNGSYSTTLPLAEVGRFEAKAFFMPDNQTQPVWPTGGNTVIKVEPAHTVRGNAVYSAFVRQFGPHWRADKAPTDFQDGIRALEEAGYAVIPVSGTFRDFAQTLDLVIDEMGFRIVHLLPVHPTPTTYARMGRFGSPFAALDYCDVDRALAEFDRKTTPLEQFTELTDAIHARDGRVFLDIPVNHTGWASRLQVEHPEWFARTAAGGFRSPGAWGVTWEDLSELDYGHKPLWTYMANVFLFWTRRGVDGFRCDAGYKVPAAAWEYIVAKVRREYPDTVFFLEGLGGKIETMETLLGEANMDWAYSELFQDEDRWRIERQLPLYVRTSEQRGLLVHFAETHDNNRLAARSPTYARMRVGLCALLAQNGGFGLANGAEWLATEKIDVHGAPSLRWGAQDNLTAWIRRLNAVLRLHPCFGPEATLRLVQTGDDNTLVLLRQCAERRLLVAVNLDAETPQTAQWRHADGADETWTDLLSGRPMAPAVNGEERCLDLVAGQVLCLSPFPADLTAIEQACVGAQTLPDPELEQEYRAQCLDARGGQPLTANEIKGLAATLAAMKADPLRFCARLAANPDSPRPAPGAVHWRWPADIRRVVMLPPEQILCVTAAVPFRATLRDAARAYRQVRGLPMADGGWFALLAPPPAPPTTRRLWLDITVFESDGVRHESGPLEWLADGHRPMARMVMPKAPMKTAHSLATLSNACGAMAQVRGAWGRIESQYDAWLAGNEHTRYPTDRRIMFARCRAWLLYRGHWQDLDEDRVESFGLSGQRGAQWRFRVPVGSGRAVTLEAHFTLATDRNAVQVVFRRISAGRGSPESLSNSEPVELILRPDIEDRISHEKTKAYAGPEREWPPAVECGADAFTFRPQRERALTIHVAQGVFRSEPEWIYGVAHPFEAERGLEGSSDLFSPGYFSVMLKGGADVSLTATMTTAAEQGPTPRPEFEPHSSVAAALPLREALHRALRAFVTRRGSGQTVLAGFPWFLDWGRDTLIALRGMIAVGMRTEARAILLEMARFEEQGTLPNMIRGADASNRDTSDAPLWFFTACADLARVENDTAFLNADCGGRTLRDVMLSIARAYRDGTPNGIRLDSRSGLIYSPPHFTWMDTNHPAGTPREGYPVEIQALWHAALRWLATLDKHGEWAAMASQTEASILALYPVASDAGGWPERYLSDCLHAARDVPAARATADDALRSNQLLAITLGALRDRDLQIDVLRACQTLLIPGALRSLADRPVRMPLPIAGATGLLNDPQRPYWGRYGGDEDTRRKPAYHNGTGWTWTYPSYIEALRMVYGAAAEPTARAYAAASAALLDQGSLGQIPEILDGDAPHAQRGCCAQAWGVSELARVAVRMTNST